MLLHFLSLVNGSKYDLKQVAHTGLGGYIVYFMFLGSVLNDNQDFFQWV